MKKVLIALITTAFLSTALAGCLGDIGFGSSAPRADVTVTATDDEYTFIFDGRDSKGDGLSYQWDFGDGTTATDARVEHTYEYGDGGYDAKLVIEDSAGTPDVWEERIIVGTGQNSPPTAFFKVEKRNYAIGENIRVDASISEDPEGDPLRYRWDFNHLMDFEEYETFRTDKKAAVEAAEDGGLGGGPEDEEEEDGGDEGEPQSAPGSLSDLLEKLDPNNLLGYKHAGHGGGGNQGPDPSLFAHTKETEDAVYVLEGGFPDATVFFIRLQVWDIKGDHEEILSEEIWPVEVWDEPPETTVKGGTKGNFTLGADGQVSDLYYELGGDDETLSFRGSHEFVIEWPIAPSTRASNWAPTGAINLTWEAESDETLPGELASKLQMNITAPNGKTFNSVETDWGLKMDLDGNNDYTDVDSLENKKPWRVEIYARHGVNIDWELEYWAKLDTNPFRTLEDQE